MMISDQALAARHKIAILADRAIARFARGTFFSGFIGFIGFIGFAGLIGFGTALLSGKVSQAEVDFIREVQPILSTNCFNCHGPDPSHRQADLRLDVRNPEDEAETLTAVSVLDFDDPAASELIARVVSDDPDLVMPPPETDKRLTSDQIATLKQWIAEGADYQPHWAFIPPERPPLPEVNNPDWVKNPIDAFVLAKLDEQGLQPSPAASEATLRRRLSLDLVGLPPANKRLGETARSPEAIAKTLLASPHYGEHWGRLWLDAARYADSDGFEKDKPRFVWMYRDWVIDSLNADMPYDQFVKQQIAGDLMDKPVAGQNRQDLLVATGFLRNSMINEEGGIDPEQFRMEAMFDRVDAMGKSMLGLTLQCAQCHSHKYDPLKHTEYYGLFAFLNSCDEGAATTYTKQQQAEWTATKAVIDRIEQRLKADHPTYPERMAAWEAEISQPQESEWTVVRPTLDGSGGQKLTMQPDGSVLAEGFAPVREETKLQVDVPLTRITAIKLELLNDPNLPHGGPGRSADGLCALTEFKATATPLVTTSLKDAKHAQGGKTAKIEFINPSADVNPPRRELPKRLHNKGKRPRYTGPIAYAVDGDPLTAWGIDIGAERSNVPHEAVFPFKQPLKSKTGFRLNLTLLQQHGGWNNNDNQTNNLGRYRLLVTNAEAPTANPLPVAIQNILAINSAERTELQRNELFSYWRTTVDEWEEINQRLDALWQSHPRGTTQLVLTERTIPRDTYRLERGDFLQPAEKIEPGVPAFLPPLDTSGKPTRLDLANWLVDRRSPTAARAMVNRVWQAYFGIGFVPTPDDLGTQCEPPSHPELLDWLAVELMENDWSLKHLHSLIVNSATYQQSSQVTEELLARDPQNRLLARGARFRVDAEVVRDISLSVSGLLTNRIGGPSVFPPAPKFLFNPPISYGYKTWNYDQGADKYRRGLYTFRFRSVPFPMLQIFDSPVRNISCVRRARSNTPLQALTSLNEPLFMECAQALAERIINDGGKTDTERLEFAIQVCLNRSPRQEELAVMTDYLQREQQKFAKQAKEALAMIGGTLPNQTTEPTTLAAWTSVARVLINLDETITRE